MGNDTEIKFVGQPHLWIDLKELIRLVKTLPDARRSRTHSCRHIADAAANLKALHKLLDGKTARGNKISDERKPASSVHHPACKMEKDRVVPIPDEIIENVHGFKKRCTG